MNLKSPHISKQFLTTMTFCQFWFGMKGSHHTSMRDKPTYVCAKNFSSFFKVAMDRNDCWIGTNMQYMSTSVLLKSP